MKIRVKVKRKNSHKNQLNRLNRMTRNKKHRLKEMLILAVRMKIQKKKLLSKRKLRIRKSRKSYRKNKKS